MTCRELIDFLGEYHEGTLEPAVRAAFEAHLRACAHCREFLTTYRQTVHMAKSLGPGDGDCMEIDVPEDLVQAVLAARRRVV